MRRIARVFAVALAVFALAGTAAQALDTPALTGRVVDEARVLSAGTHDKLESVLKEHEQQTGNQVVVATLSSLRGMTIEQYGYQLGRAWGIGQKGHNNGALILVSPATHDVRIEVGYGLEGTLTDAQSALIVQNVMLPAFRKGDYDSGILNGTLVTLQALGGHPSTAPPQDFRSLQQDAAGNGNGGGSGFHVPILLIVIVLWLIFGRFFWPLFFLGGGRGWGGGGGFGGGGGWGGGSGGGGFSGGGGSFGGGGASGHW